MESTSNQISENKTSNNNESIEPKKEEEIKELIAKGYK